MNSEETLNFKSVTEAEEILNVNNITKYYGKVDMGAALNAVNFKVNKGEFIALTGASGSGKSTLLKIIGLTENTSSGKIYFNRCIDADEMTQSERAIFRRRNIGFVFQFFNLIPVLNVKENIILPLKIDGEKPDNYYIEYLISTLHIENITESYPDKLSGGEQQRVAIARAMAAKPQILLADEPTGNLDSKNRQDILELMRTANTQTGQTIIMAAHDLALADMADRIITLCDGRITGDKKIKTEGK